MTNDRNGVPSEAVRAGLNALVEGLRRKHPGAVITVQNEASPKRSTSGLQKGAVIARDNCT